jgi:transposase
LAGFSPIFSLGLLCVYLFNIFKALDNLASHVQQGLKISALLNIDSSNKIKKFIAMEKPMINCPKCQHSESRKDGIVRKKQRYLCKSCGYRYTVAHKGYSEEVKQQALAMYLEGLGFRSIGRLLSCSHTAAYYWIRKYGEKSSLTIAESKIEVVEMDEGHPYIGSKKSVLAMDCR